MQAFFAETGVNELIAISALYNLNKRLKSARLFADIIPEIKEEQNQNNPAGTQYLSRKLRPPNEKNYSRKWY